MESLESGRDKRQSLDADMWELSSSLSLDGDKWLIKLKNDKKPDQDAKIEFLKCPVFVFG